MYDPLQLPAPSRIGYAGDLRVPGDFDFAYNMGELPEIRDPIAPDRVAQEFEYGYPDIQLPDVVSVYFGAGDRETVGDLIRIVNGEEAGLEGVSPEIATYLLNQWGYPTTFDAWSSDEWEAALASNQPASPLDGLGYTDPGSVMVP